MQFVETMEPTIGPRAAVCGSVAIGESTGKTLSFLVCILFADVFCQGYYTFFHLCFCQSLPLLNLSSFSNCLFCQDFGLFFERVVISFRQGAFLSKYLLVRSLFLRVIVFFCHLLLLYSFVRLMLILCQGCDLWSMWLFSFFRHVFFSQGCGLHLSEMCFSGFAVVRHGCLLGCSFVTAVVFCRRSCYQV